MIGNYYEQKREINNKVENILINYYVYIITPKYNEKVMSIVINLCIFFSRNKWWGLWKIQTHNVIL